MNVQETYAALRTQAARVIVEQEQVLEQLFIALLVRGHVLLEGVPGTAKTLMAKTLAHLVSAPFNRVQFTPDLMPSDILGTNVFDMTSGKFHLRRGPIFTGVLLADEINRAPAKTQSALLEAMEERHVTIDGELYPLPDPFLVVATQNPVEYEGTWPLPEAQLDRFLFKVQVAYLRLEAECQVLQHYHNGFDPHDLIATGLQPVVDPDGLRAARDEIRQVHVEDGVMRYIAQIAQASRESRDLILGGSTRASVALLLSSKACALLHGRDYITPDDVKALVPPVYRHRIILKPEAEIEGLDADGVMVRILNTVEVPR
jgi:MoxR-like ATPase